MLWRGWPEFCVLGQYFSLVVVTATSVSALDSSVTTRSTERERGRGSQTNSQPTPPYCPLPLSSALLCSSLCAGQAELDLDKRLCSPAMKGPLTILQPPEACPQQTTSQNASLSAGCCPSMQRSPSARLSCHHSQLQPPQPPNPIIDPDKDCHVDCYE